MEPELHNPADLLAPAGRKPRIMLMGEFSAGKSTLANLLMGQGVSPVRVTATQLPPVWYVHGTPSARRIDASGREVEMSLEDMNQISPQNTRAVKVFLDAEVLEFCDLIDMPGTSDPNMAPEVWESMVSRADGVVWCTPSTQAWRQTEAALWDELSVDLSDRSLLLITRMDKLLTERDRARVVARVRREVDGQFRAVFPLSLTQAMAAGDDEDALQECGAADFVDSLIGLVEEIAPLVADDDDSAEMANIFGGAVDDFTDEEDLEQPVNLTVVSSRDEGDEGESLFADDAGDDAEDDDDADAVLPRRVVRDGSRRVRTRPRSAPTPI